VLEEKREDEAGDDEKLSIHENAHQRAAERENRGIGFEPPLDVPLVIEVGNQAVEHRGRSASSAQ